MARIKVKLNSSSINETIAKLNNLKQELVKLEDTLPEELATQTSSKIEQFYAQKGFEGTSTPSIGVAKYGDGYKAFARGPEVIYEEFGTGDAGANNGHPWKGDYGLNPYNSGITIRSTDKLSPEKKAEHGIQNGLYWTFKRDGEKIYTQGIPSGKFMYNADLWLKDNYKKIVIKKVDDILSKL